MDKGKAKMSEYKDDKSDGNESPPSLDSKFGVPIKRTPAAKKSLTSANEKLCRLSREKNSVTRFGYNEYMAHHYVFTMKASVRTKRKDRV